MNYPAINPYIGGEDYIPFSTECLLRSGSNRKCIGIIILDDSMVEVNETFEVVIEELGLSANVTIIDEDVMGELMNN